MIVVDGTQHAVTGDFAETFNSVVRRKSRLIQVFGEHEVTMLHDMICLGMLSLYRVICQ